MRFSDADREAICRAGELFVKNALAKPRDDRASAACYEEDAIMLAPGQSPMKGSAAIEGFLSSFPPFSDYRLEVAEIVGDGDLAFERGSASMTLRPTGEPAQQLRINYLLIWRRQPDGSWRAAREVFTPAA
jgi:ketosteroid isomerase-like protein